jgi:HAD superfamily hydrolase (TIGR01490 family)
MTSQHPVAAIFDMDYTLLSDSSGRLFFRYLHRTGRLHHFFRRRDLAKFLGASFLYKLGLLDPTWLLINAGRASAGQDVEHLWEISRLWFSDDVIDFISSGARERLQWHQAQGHIPIICSGSSQFAVHLVAEHLGVEEWISTEWVVHNGYLTGELRQPLTYGMGKVYWMEQWADQRGVDLRRSYFYTDHISDRPLLERVAYPVAVNPDRQLAQIARRRAWEVLHWA